MRKTQRYLEIQLEGLKLENQKLQQTTVISQKLIHGSKKQLEAMEENGRELKKLVPLLQQAATLIECSRVAQNGLSASLSHTSEWVFQSLHNSQGKHSQQGSQVGHHHIRQSSIQTQASSRLSSDISSDCEGEVRAQINEQALVSEELRRLSANIVAKFPSFVSYESQSIVTNPLSGASPISGTDHGTNTRVPLARPLSDDSYDHLSDIGMYKGSDDKVTMVDNQSIHPPLAMQGCCSPHLCKRFKINS